MITFAPQDYISIKVMKRKWNELLHHGESRLVEHAKPQKDFERASTILAHSHVHLSASSLKRLWNYSFSTLCGLSGLGKFAKNILRRRNAAGMNGAKVVCARRIPADACGNGWLLAT